MEKSLKSRVASVLGLVLVIYSIVLFVIIRIISQQTLHKHIHNDIYTRQYEMVEGMMMVLDEVNLLYSRMVLNREFQDLLTNKELPIEEKEILFQTIMLKVGVNEEIFHDVLIIYEDMMIRLNNDLLSQHVPDPIFIHQVRTSERLLEQGRVIEGLDEQHYLIIGKPMVNFPVGNVMGGIIFYLNEITFRDFSQNIPKDLGYSFIIDANSQVITHSKGMYIGTTIFDEHLFLNTKGYEIREINNERSYIIANEFDKLNRRYDFDWRIVSVISYDLLFMDVLKINRYNILIGILMTIGAVFFSLRISRKIIKPINVLIEDLRIFTKTGEVKKKEKSAIKDELWELENTYEEMILRITELMKKNKEDMEAQRKLELYALQMQINPHFLYNSLDAIAWMAKLEKKPQIEKLVLALAKFFRISLHKGDRYIKVIDEIELVKNFIEIELIRFPDKFTVEYQVQERVEQEETLKLILQPIIENAIKHGISQLEGQGHIKISVKGDKKHLFYEVIDNGVGFEPSDDLFKNSHVMTGGYGLKNVDERIKLEYGMDSGISVYSKPNMGTRVVVIIKRRYQDDEQNEEKPD